MHQSPGFILATEDMRRADRHRAGLAAVDDRTSTLDRHVTSRSPDRGR
jgi:hypothetical protein